MAQPLEFFLPHVQLLVQQRTLLCRAHLCLLMLQECRLELGLQMDMVLLCCSRTLGGLFSEGVSPCYVCGHGCALFLEGCQRLRGFCMARCHCCASLASLHLLLNSLEGFLGLANGLTELPNSWTCTAACAALPDGHPVPSAVLATLSAVAVPARRAGVMWCFPAYFVLSGCAVVAGVPRMRRRLAALRLRLCQRLHGGRVSLLPLLCLGLCGVPLLP